MKFLVDANLGRKFTNLLKDEGHDALYSKDILPLSSDEEILNKAEKEGRIVISNDKDFGELVFRLGKKSAGVIFLRTAATDSKKRLELAKDAFDKAQGKFIVVKEGQVKVRDLK